MSISRRGFVYFVPRAAWVASVRCYTVGAGLFGVCWEVLWLYVPSLLGHVGLGLSFFTRLFALFDGLY